MAELKGSNTEKIFKQHLLVNPKHSKNIHIMQQQLVKLA